jgi:peptidoglycan/xylan/chitin deacetylase (PgdA/CDA1 family)
MLRSLAKDGTAYLFHRTGADQLMRFAQETPVVIGYHRVVEDFTLSARTSIPPMLISRQMFERHLDWIGQQYQFISLDELGSALESEKKFDRPVAAITFDDGYSDLYYNAFPILKRKGIPAAVFAVATWIGDTQPLLHDRLYSVLSAHRHRGSALELALRELSRGAGTAASQVCRLATQSEDPFTTTRALLVALSQEELLYILEELEEKIGEQNSSDAELQPLSWNMLSEMQRAGITVGSHTSTHPILTNEGRQKIREEVGGSRRILEEKLGVPIHHFAYPDGRFDAATIQALDATGYRYGYTTCRHRDLKYPLLTIPRRILWEKSCLNFHEEFSPAVMSCQMNGIFDLIGGCAQKHSLDANVRDRVPQILSVESRL